MFVELGMPVLLVLLGIMLSKIQIFIDSPERLLEPHLLPLKQRILVNDKLFRPSENPEDDVSPR
jgi:hypothetical protein